MTSTLTVVYILTIILDQKFGQTPVDIARLNMIFFIEGRFVLSPGFVKTKVFKISATSLDLLNTELDASEPFKLSRGHCDEGKTASYIVFSLVVDFWISKPRF